MFRFTRLSAVLPFALFLASVHTYSQSWRSLGPEGGWSWGIGKDSNGVFYMGLMPGGLYRSTDQGMSWEQTGLKVHYIYSVAVNSKGTLFAGTYFSEVGFLRSTDGG